MGITFIVPVFHGKIHVCSVICDRMLRYLRRVKRPGYQRLFNLLKRQRDHLQHGTIAQNGTGLFELTKRY